jgi:ankyrin repeat protein
MLNIFFSAIPQLVSLPISILSLALASCRLYYSQRLGTFSEPDPSLKMILIILLPIICLISGILYSFIFIAIFYEWIAIVLLAVTLLANYIILKSIYCRTPEIEKNIERLYNNQKESGTKEINHLFWMSIFTAWVSPCSVWTNNLSSKSRFLLFSSSITIAVHLLGNVALNYSFLTVHTNLIYFYVAISLLILSLISSIFLQIFGNYFTMFSLTHCPKIFPHCLNDITSRFAKLDEKEKAKWLKWVRTALTKTPECYKLVQLKMEIFQKFSKNNQDLEELEAFLKNFNTSGEEGAKENMNTPIWSPMHKAVKEKKFGLWCFYKLLGGEAAALNGHTKSSIQIISQGINKDETLLNNCNPIVRWLVKNSMKMYGSNALINAVKLGDAVLMQKLIENGYDTLVTDADGNTLLHTALEKGHSECAKLLTRYDTNVNAENKEKFTALHLAAELGNLECIELLVQKGANINAKTIHSETPLHCVVKKEHLPCLQFLIEKKASMKEKDISGQTVVHYAAIKRNLDCLKCLIENKGDLEDKDFSGKTALHFAAENKSAKCLQLLLECKANVNSQDYSGKTPLHYFAIKGLPGDLKNVVANNSDLEIRDDLGKTALQNAVENENLESLKILIAHKANLEVRDVSGKTPLHYAAETNQFQALKFLIDNQANLEEKDEKGRTAVYFAAENDHAECLSHMIRKGADLNVPDKNGITPIQKAGSNGSSSCWKLLYEHTKSVSKLQELDVKDETDV